MRLQPTWSGAALGGGAVLIDNHDSFTYNLVHWLGVAGMPCRVISHDALDLALLEELSPSALVLGPGPGLPSDAGPLLAIARAWLGRCPMLGVCLGQQALAEATGGQLRSAERMRHGETSPLLHTGRGLFEEVPQGTDAMRYHSWVVDDVTLPPCWRVDAWVDEGGQRGDPMAMAHRSLPAWGVQFHPESVVSPAGPALAQRWVALAAAHVNFRVAALAG